MHVLRQRHLFHILPCSPWPLTSSMSAWYFVSGFAFYMHKVRLGGYFFMGGFFSLGSSALFWFQDIVHEAASSGYHTMAVRKGIQLGFLLFIISEIMLFFGFFWSFFHTAFSPSTEFGSVFPPVGLFTIPVLEFPIFNTFILIFSGLSVTWAHRALGLGIFKEGFDSLLLTAGLGFSFIILQMIEYNDAFFNFADSVYACAFFMLTGLHGGHVFVGASFLSICILRFAYRQFLQNHYLGLVFAIWYWHFVDVVWIFLLITVYFWGSWEIL